MLKGICKYCGQEKELINSHIIPQSLCQTNKFGPMVAVDSVSRKFDHNPKHQNGIKEPLLCKECDNLLGKLDNYASKVFKQIIPNHKWDIINNHYQCKLLPSEVDYWMFKKFFISLIWRASIASSGIHLGKYEDIAFKMLKGEIQDNPNLFMPLVYVMNTKTPVDLITGVFGNKTLGKHIYIFQFPGYKIHIIPNIEHSRNRQQMEQLKTLFNPQSIIIQPFLIPTIHDKYPMDVLTACQKRELKRKKKT